MKCLSGMVALVLMSAIVASAETYVFDHTTTSWEETVILNDLLRTCRQRLTGGQSLPGYCSPDCATCTPNTAQKAAYVQDQAPTPWMQTKRRELRQARRDEVCNVYKQASDELRAQVDPLVGMPPVPTVGTADTYSWTLVTTNPQERVIRGSLRQACQAAISASQPPPAGCTAECDCTAATSGDKLDHLWQEAFTTWFAAAWQRLRNERYSQFCGLYPEADRATQDQIDAILGLSPLE